MLKLLYKEFRLASHPTSFIFLALGAMLLIPAYPYFVVFFYTCLGIFFVFLAARENHDTVFTVSLPVRKRDVVKARVFMVVIIELAQLVIAVPFALLGAAINPNAEGNAVGIEANPAFFGLTLVMLALFNIIFIPTFYKTAYKVGKAFAAAVIPLGLYIILAEGIVRFVPALKTTLDTTDAAYLPVQLIVLAAGAVIFAAGNIAAFRLAAARFDKVDL